MFWQGLCRISRDCLSHRGEHYGQFFKNQMQRKIAARLVELPLAQTATCSHLPKQPLAATCSHLQPLAKAATCSHLLKQPLAATCGHLPKQPLGRHLQPLGSHLLKQPLAATCSHLQPLASHLAAPCSSSHLQPLAATRRHLPQVAAASGCQVASFLKIQLRTSCAHNANLSTLSTF